MNTWYIQSSTICKEASHGRNRIPRTTIDTTRAFGDAAGVADPARVVDPRRVADPRAIADPGRSTANGDGPMMTSSAVGGRASGNGLSAELTEALVSLWTQYAGKPPSGARTEVRGNVVTCVLVDAVGDYDAGLIEAQRQNLENPASGRTDAGYKSEAAATVTDLTGRRVTSFISSHDRDTNVATETFTLEARVHSGSRDRWGRTDRTAYGPQDFPDQTQPERTGMPKQITSDQVVAAAEGLGKAEFTRADLAQELGVDKPKKFRPGFRQARQAGRLDKVRDDEEGTGHFRLTDR
jgi:uncharacterized protein YbcI